MGSDFTAFSKSVTEICFWSLIIFSTISALDCERSLLFIGEYLVGAFRRPAKSAASPIESSDELLLKYRSDAASKPYAPEPKYTLFI